MREKEKVWKMFIKCNTDCSFMVGRQKINNKKEEKKKRRNKIWILTWLPFLPSCQNKRSPTVSELKS